ETLENIRYRIEQTDESMISIAADVGVHRNTLRLLKLREKWERKVPVRVLPPAAKLLAQVQKLEEETQALPEPIPPEAPMGAEAPLAASLADVVVVGDETSLPDLPSTIERLNRAVLEELAAVETMRAQLIREPQSPVDAERTARTLSILTETLQK